MPTPNFLPLRTREEGWEAYLADFDLSSACHVLKRGTVGIRENSNPLTGAGSGHSSWCICERVSIRASKLQYCFNCETSRCADTHPSCLTHFDGLANDEDFSQTCVLAASEPFSHHESL